LQTTWNGSSAELARGVPADKSSACSARAIHRDPDILLLDEATSALSDRSG